MTTVEGFRERVFWAFTQLQARRGRRIEHAELGEAVARRVGKDATFSPSTVGRWLRGAVPDLPVIAALAAELEVDPGWLAFGEASAAPPPVNPVAALAQPVPRRRSGGNEQAS